MVNRKIGGDHEQRESTGSLDSVTCSSIHYIDIYI